MKNKYAKDAEEFSTGFTGDIKSNRGCTDICCLVVYWAFIAGMVFATMYGLKHGDVHKLTAPIDADLHFCGFGDYKDYPKMVLMDFMDIKNLLKSGVCVKECPTAVGELKEGTDCKGNDIKTCSDHKGYPTEDIFDFCVPKNA